MLIDLAPEVLVGVRRDGEFLVADGNDPQIVFRPAIPIPAGWCRVVCRLDGQVANPRVYFDFGEAFRECWSVALEKIRSQPQHHAITWLPHPAVRLRLDPSDAPCTIRLPHLTVDSLSLEELARELSNRDPERLPDPGHLARLRRIGRYLFSDRGRLPRPTFTFSNSRVLFSEYSHLSRVSFVLAAAARDKAQVMLRLHRFEFGTVVLDRTVVLGAEDALGRGCVYWEPVRDSLHRYFLITLDVVLDGGPQDPSAAPTLATVSLVYSPPETDFDHPRAVLFSPVNQCNLNCTHCISAPTRSKFQIASDRVWREISGVAREPGFLHLAMDYSGDILFSERRHGGMLDRLAMLDVPLRIDTNANHLDDGIIEKLLHSRLFEINFSLDSMDAEVYREVRRGAMPLPEVLARIRRFMVRKQALGRHVKTVLSFVLMRSNAHTIKPALRFAKEHGIDCVQLIPVLAFSDAIADEVFVGDTEAYGALYRELQEESSGLGVPLGMPRPIEYPRWEDSHCACAIPWGIAVVLSNGDVMACCVPGTRMGNLNGASLKEIWNGRNYRDFRTRVNTPNPPKACRTCPISRVESNLKAYYPGVSAARTEALCRSRGLEAR